MQQVKKTRITRGIAHVIWRPPRRLGDGRRGWEKQWGYHPFMLRLRRRRGKTMESPPPPLRHHPHRYGRLRLDPPRRNNNTPNLRPSFKRSTMIWDHPASPTPNLPLQLLRHLKQQSFMETARRRSKPYSSASKTTSRSDTSRSSR